MVVVFLFFFLVLFVVLFPTFRSLKKRNWSESRIKFVYRKSKFCWREKWPERLTCLEEEESNAQIVPANRINLKWTQTCEGFLIPHFRRFSSGTFRPLAVVLGRFTRPLEPRRPNWGPSGQRKTELTPPPPVASLMSLLWLPCEAAPRPIH